MTGSLPSNGDILLDFSDIENNVTSVSSVNDLINSDIEAIYKT